MAAGNAKSPKGTLPARSAESPSTGAIVKSHLAFISHFLLVKVRVFSMAITAYSILE